MNRIRKVSTFLLILLNSLLVAMPVFFTVLWLCIETGPIKEVIQSGALLSPVHTPEGLINLAAVPWTTLAKAMGFTAFILSALPLWLGLFALKDIFKNYQNGAIFTGFNARRYNYVGWLFFFNALLIKPFGDALMVVAVTLTNPPGHRYITFGFGSPTFGALFCGAIIVVISWVMMEASKLHDEQQFTI